MVELVRELASHFEGYAGRLGPRSRAEEISILACGSVLLRVRRDVRDSCVVPAADGSDEPSARGVPGFDTGRLAVQGQGLAARALRRAVGYPNLVAHGYAGEDDAV